nr:hypothetical protein [Tanacetum cinerariifolium]
VGPSTIVSVESEDKVHDTYAPKTQSPLTLLTTKDVYVPRWNVTNSAQIDNRTIFRNLLDHVTPPGKSPTTLRRLIKQGADESVGFGSAASATEDFASSSITPISDHEYEDDSDHGDN